MTATRPIERIKTVLGPRVIVEVDRVEEKTEAGIYIANQARHELNTGTVLYAGSPRAKQMGSVFNEGDRVMFYPGEALSLPDIPGHKGLKVIMDEAVIAELEPEGESSESACTQKGPKPCD